MSTSGLDLPFLVFAPAFILAPFVIGPIIIFPVAPIVVFTQEKDPKSSPHTGPLGGPLKLLADSRLSPKLFAQNYGLNGGRLDPYFKRATILPRARALGCFIDVDQYAQGMKAVL